MMQLYPSNKTESLAYLIAEIIDKHPLSSVFAEETILIQSQGMGTWLQQELSAHSGISALIDCKMPASFIWTLAEQLMPEHQHIPLFEKNNVRWEIFRRLPEKLHLAAFHPLQRYLNAQSQIEQKRDEAVPAHPIKPSQQKVLFELSCVIADVFDAYQNYRPDWIEKWERSETILDNSQADLKDTERWQSELWRSLYPDISLKDRLHRSRLLTQLMEKLRHPSASLKAALPERLFIFGLSALPPQWLPFMSALGKHIDIHFMVHNPCQYYWGDVLTDIQQLKLEQSLISKGVSEKTAADSFLENNALLASWGKLGRDYISLLSVFPGIEEVPANLFDQLDEADTEQSYTALQWLQNDILNLQSTHHQVEDDDYSIRFASCHSHLREVEALQDYLFALLNQNPDLNPKDIIVMMPDVQDFAALIDAVFSRPAFDQAGLAHYLPYGISDQLLSMDQPLLDTLSALLALSSSRVTGSDVLDWLEMPAIRSRFGISESDLEVIKEWIEHLNIRWGLSETHKDSVLQGQRSGAFNTWLNASRRLLAGYVFGQEKVVGDMAGLNTSPREGAGTAAMLAFPQRSPERQELAGKLMRFLDVIATTLSTQSKQLILSEWLVELSALWQSWLDFEWVSSDIQQLLNSIETALEKELSYTQFDLPVNFSVVAAVVKTHIENQRISQRFLAGRINFCTLMPMRSIPFKLVCMLGMNEGAYPRPVQGQSFDLLTVTPSRTGDRSRREDDRYLFLEALCSARSHLYISYCGKDIQDNSERYPSILVSELQTYCTEHFSKAPPATDDVSHDLFSDEHNQVKETENILETWLIEHYLQPFHPEYYFQDSHKHESLGKRVHPSQGQFSKTFASEWLPLINLDLDKSDVVIEQGDLSHGAPNEGFNSIVPDSTVSDSTVPMDLDRLIACVSHPLRYYYQFVLNLSFSEIGDEMQASEPFSVLGLSAYDLKKELVANWFERQHAQTAEDALFTRWQLSGKLPSAPLDGVYVDQVKQSLQPMYAQLMPCLDETVQQHTLAFQLEQYHLSGSLLTLGNQLIDLSLSKNMGMQFFSFWVKHVFWSLHCAQTGLDQKAKQAVPTSRLIGPEKEFSLPLLAQDVAQTFALEICTLFQQALASPQVFLPKTAYAMLFETESKARTAFNGTQFFSGENTDPYWQRYCLMHQANLSDEEAISAEQKERCSDDIVTRTPQDMPELNQAVLYQQVEQFKDSINISKVDASSGTEVNSSQASMQGAKGKV
ncbi:MAG: exodeoxyribonuclease V subunit gamma [Oleiphilus sp.]